MDNREAGRCWNEAAEAWTALTRAGFDVFRDGLNTPAFFSKLPELRGLKGIDIGCGEGHNTRLLAEKGAAMQAIDISEIFIGHASASEHASPLGIQYQVASATALPFYNEQFDFATSFMCLMDMPDPELALQEAYRVLKAVQEVIICSFPLPDQYQLSFFLHHPAIEVYGADHPHISTGIL